MAMLFSWKLAYANIAKIIQGDDFHEGHSQENLERCASMASLDHVIDQVSGSLEREKSNEQPLLQNPKPLKIYPSDEDLKKDFRLGVIFIVTATVINSLLILEPLLETNFQTDTLRYVAGSVIYLVLFTSLLVVQVYVMFEGFIVYFQWRRLIIPPPNYVNTGEEGSA